MISCNLLRGMSRGWYVLTGCLGLAVLLLSGMAGWQQRNYERIHPFRIWASQQQDFSAWMANKPQQTNLTLPIKKVIIASSSMLDKAPDFIFNRDGAILSTPWQGEFNTLLKWLLTLQQQYGIKISQIEIAANTNSGMITLMHASFTR